MRTLLIDDMRDIYCDCVVRNAELAKAVLAAVRPGFDVIYFDHDLGPGENGLDVMRWMFHEVFVRPQKIFLVTLNPDGRKSMEMELKDNGYIQECLGSCVWIDGEASYI